MSVTAASTSVFLDLARRGLRAPLVTDLFLHEGPDPEEVRRDGALLARVVEQAAQRWGSPLGLPLMDLRLDKQDLVAALGVNDEDAADRFHLDRPLDAEQIAALERTDVPLSAGSRARDVAVRQVARSLELLPIGLVIGPFSLATKLLADPITAAAMYGSGVGPDEDSGIRMLLDALDAAERVVQRAARRQAEAGAKAMIVCEPTASVAFLSPRQIKAGSPVFERLVVEPNLRLKGILDAAGVALIFHDCGELTDAMVGVFGHRLRPAVLSLGGSRSLPHDAALVPDDVVLYGNLPTKSFYNDAAMPVEEVRRLTGNLLDGMRTCGHPHILGSECDVLHVPDAAATIRAKVEAMMSV